MERIKLPAKRRGNPNWVKGVSGNPNGKPVGAVAKFPKIVKDAGLTGAELVGHFLKDRAIPGGAVIHKWAEEMGVSDDLARYMAWCALRFPQAYLGFLARIMPTQGNAQTDLHKQEVYPTLEEAQARLRELGVPLKDAHKVLQLSDYREVKDVS